MAEQKYWHAHYWPGPNASSNYWHSTYWPASGEELPEAPAEEVETLEGTHRRREWFGIFIAFLTPWLR